jgi:hypothetical protein
MVRLPRGLGVDESRRLDFLRFDCIYQHPDIAELRSSILTTHSMTCQSLYVAFPTTLPRSKDGPALGTDRNAGSRIRLCSSSLVRQHTVIVADPFTTAEILQRQVLFTRPDISERCQGSWSSRRNVSWNTVGPQHAAVTNRLIGCTGPGLADRFV